MVPRSLRRAWLRLPIVVRALVIALPILTLSVVATSVSMVGRIARDDSYCTEKCHADSHLAPDRTAHRSTTTCQSCHGAGTGVLLWASSLSQRLGVPNHGEVVEATCSNCHNWVRDESWRLTAASPGHRGHANGGAAVACLACHGGTLHRGKIDAASCLGCHDYVERAEHGSEDVARTGVCVGCHSFRGVAADQRTAIVTACTECHAAPQSRGEERPATRAIQAGALHAGTRCNLCHGLHGDTPTRQQRRLACDGCHQVSLAATPAPSGHEDCARCHPPHAPAGTATAACRECHGAGGDATERALAAGSAVRHESCADCHAPHTWTVAVAQCAGCHGTQQAGVNSRQAAGHRSCTDCHPGHSEGDGLASCANCHRVEAARHGGAPKAHGTCTTCHTAHGEGLRDCQSCHQRHAAESVTAPAGHQRGCSTCHATHGDPTATPAACARCHAEQSRAAATASEVRHQDCTSCHLGHRFGLSLPGAACARCHADVKKDRPAHRDACSSCHASHGEPRVARSRCVECHQSSAHAAAGGHAECSACHAPHEAATKSTPCAKCHAPEAAAASLWKADSAHGGACVKCHDPHAEAPRATCASCHQDQARHASDDPHGCVDCHPPHQRPDTAAARCAGCHRAAATATARHPKEHRACVDCHAPHAAKGSTTASCARCHATEAAAAARSRGEHARCGSCHRSHAFTVPTCTGCHADANRPGGHALPGHALPASNADRTTGATCTRCHASHDRAAVDRRACLGCHSGLAQHYPKARSCQSCHPF